MFQHDKINNELENRNKKWWNKESIKWENNTKIESRTTEDALMKKEKY